MLFEKRYPNDHIKDVLKRTKEDLDRAQNLLIRNSVTTDKTLPYEKELDIIKEVASAEGRLNYILDYLLVEDSDS